MKEILYIQAGELSNYVGTHFWNTQESYLQVDESQDSEITSDISFCETKDAQVRGILFTKLCILKCFREGPLYSLVCYYLIENVGPRIES